MLDSSLGPCPGRGGRSKEETVSNRPTHIVLAAALLLLLAAPARGDMLEGPVRREAPREGRTAPRERTTAGPGIQGVTLIRFHAGISSPTGSFSDGFDTGWGAGAGVAYGVSPRVLISGDLAYHHFEEKGASGRMEIVPFTVGADYVIPTSGRVHPWVGGGIGIYHLDVSEDVLVDLPPLAVVRVSDSQTDAGIHLGAGVGGPLGARTDWGVGFRIHEIFEGSGFPSSDFITVQFGIGVRP